MNFRLPRTTDRLLPLVVLLFLASRNVGAQSSAADGDQVAKESEVADPVRMSQEIVRFSNFLRHMPAFLNSDASPVAKELAADAMREFRYVEGIPALVKNLVVVKKSTRFGSDMVPYSTSCACALALYDFGQVSVEPLVSLIGRSHDRFEIEVAAHTISDILGEEKTIQQLSVALTSTDHPDEKKNLDAALFVVRTSN